MKCDCKPILDHYKISLSGSAILRNDMLFLNITLKNESYKPIYIPASEWLYDGDSLSCLRFVSCCRTYNLRNEIFILNGVCDSLESFADSGDETFPEYLPNFYEISGKDSLNLNIIQKQIERKYFFNTKNLNAQIRIYYAKSMGIYNLWEFFNIDIIGLNEIPGSGNNESVISLNLPKNMGNMLVNEFTNNKITQTQSKALRLVFADYFELTIPIIIEK